MNLLQTEYELTVFAQATKLLFVASLFKFIKDHNFGALLLVSGVDPVNRTDAQMR